MNEFDKAVAQQNGLLNRIPPKIIYYIQWIPNDTDYSRIVRRDNKIFVYTRFVNNPEERIVNTNEKVIEILPQWINTSYSFYYDDSNETESERLEKINNLNINNDEVKRLSGYKIKHYNHTMGHTYDRVVPEQDMTHNSLLRLNELYAQLEFDFKVIRKEYIEDPTFNYFW